MTSQNLRLVTLAEIQHCNPSCIKTLTKSENCIVLSIITGTWHGRQHHD